MFPILYSAGVFTRLSISNNGGYNENGNGIYYFYIDNLEKIVTFCEENHVLWKFESYLNDSSFRSTIGTFCYDQDDVNYIYDKQEKKDHYQYLEGEFLKSLQWQISDGVGIWKNNIVEQPNKEAIRDAYERAGLLKLENGNKESIQNYGKQQYAQNRADIDTLENTIYNYKQYLKLMPYERYMEDPRYLEYLVQNYTSYYKSDDDLSYLDYKEIALYSMLNDQSFIQAKGYINAMQDTINQRRGLAMAADRIKEFGGADGFIKSGLYGFGDGVQNYFDGL